MSSSDGEEVIAYANTDTKAIIRTIRITDAVL